MSGHHPRTERNPLGAGRPSIADRSVVRETGILVSASNAERERVAAIADANRTSMSAVIRLRGIPRLWDLATPECPHCGTRNPAIPLTAGDGRGRPRTRRDDDDDAKTKPDRTGRVL